MAGRPLVRPGFAAAVALCRHGRGGLRRQHWPGEWNFTCLLAGCRVSQNGQDRENPGNPDTGGSGAEGATAPVNSQAQGTVSAQEDSGEWRMRRPPKG